MRHLILGTGNLGFDLTRALESAGEKTHHLTRSAFTFEGRDSYPVSMRDLAGEKFDVVWNTVGAGGPGAAPAPAMFSAHVMLPLALAEWAPKLICFSTTYLNNDNEGRYSDYAMSKRVMELTLEKRDNVRCLRVGSLYGDHLPFKTLPGKMVKAFLDGRLKHGALNTVTPTPTAWLAEQLVALKTWDRFGSLAPGTNFSPCGAVSVKEWIELIITEFGEVRPSLEHFLAEDYPSDASGRMLMDLSPSWFGLWREYGPKTLQAVKRGLTLARS